MTYLPTMGSIEAINFNSTKYPGVCKPTNEVTLQKVYRMQEQVNRVSKMKGLKIISVDGDIGPGTRAAVAAIVPYLAPMQFDASTCMAVAINADDIANQAQSVADGLGAPAKVAAPIPPKAPSIVTNLGMEIKAPPPIGASALDSFKNLGMPTLLALGVGVVGVGYFMTRKKKGHK